MGGNGKRRRVSLWRHQRQPAGPVFPSLLPSHSQKILKITTAAALTWPAVEQHDVARPRRALERERRPALVERRAAVLAAHWLARDRWAPIAGVAARVHQLPRQQRAVARPPKVGHRDVEAAARDGRREHGRGGGLDGERGARGRRRGGGRGERAQEQQRAAAVAAAARRRRCCCCRCCHRCLCGLVSGGAHACVRDGRKYRARTPRTDTGLQRRCVAARAALRVVCSLPATAAFPLPDWTRL